MSSASVRPATADHTDACARIVYEAFRGIAAQHGFPPDFPTLDDARQLCHVFLNHGSIYGVVAELDGRVVGSNFLDERDPIRGVGPITVDPDLQARGIGRQLMGAVLERGRNSAGVRLLQDSFNTRSIGLYASLGFDVREPLLLMTGRPKAQPPRGVEVRPLQSGDLDACAELCREVHGFERRVELADALQLFKPAVAVRGGQVVAYASTVAFWPLNHGVAETEEDLRALLLGAAALTPEPLAFLLPIRQAELFRWCLAQGFRAVKPMTLMTMGAYREPTGGYFTSVLY